MQFLTSLLLAGSAIAAPASTNPPTCTQRSQKTALTVNDFDFHSSYIFTTPAHQVSSGYVNFNLTNSALDYKPLCSASSSQLTDFFYGDVVYTCQNPKNKYDTATFTFSRVNNELKVNQTWSCVKEGSRFTAEASTRFDLKCNTESYQNPDWQSGETYSSKTTKCQKVTKPLTINRITAVA